MEDAQQKDRPGTLIAYFNRKKEAGDDRPVFIGDITLQGDPNKRPLSLWATQSRRTGLSMLTGRTGHSAETQIAEHTRPPKKLEADKEQENGLEQGPEPDHEPETPETKLEAQGPEGNSIPDTMDIKENDVVLFHNEQRDAKNPDRPNYWGYWNPGGGAEIQRLGVWTNTDRAGKALLKGQVVPFSQALLKEKSKSLEEGQEHEQGMEEEPRRARAR